MQLRLAGCARMVFAVKSDMPSDIPTNPTRYLRVVYVPDHEGDGVFVVTAYPLAGRQLKALRRRKRRRRR